MYKQIGKNLCKMMVAFPIAIYWVLPHLFTEKTDTDVTGLLIGRIWGMTAGDGNNNILETVGMLSYLLIFHLLFGNSISEHFSYMASYRFSRIFQRPKWFLKKSVELFAYVVGYAGIYVGGNLWGCNYTSSGKINVLTWNVFFMMFATCVNLLLLTTILINLGTIFYKTATAFGVCWIGIVLLKLLDMVQGNSKWMGLINPMSYEKMIQWPVEMVVAKIVGLFLFTVLIVMIGAVLLKDYEVYEWKM